MIWDAGSLAQQESSELLMQYCAQIGITSEDFEWENSMQIAPFFGTKPSLGLECFHACSSVTLATRAKKFGRVVLQGWLDLQRTPRWPQ